MELAEKINDIEQTKVIFHDLLDMLDVLTVNSEHSINPPLTHRFTPGLYIREIHMPAGSLITSKIHNTEHPFIISKGTVTVMTEDGEFKLQAPHTGITKPGTRRLLFCHTDVVWTTIHAITDGETVEEIENRILLKHESPYVFIKKSEL